MKIMERKVYRSSKDRILFGVCGGIASYFNIDPVLVRLGMVALAFIDGAGVLLYIIMALVIPEAGRSHSIVEQDEAVEETEVLPPEPRPSLGSDGRIPGKREDEGRFMGGIVLILIGLFFLAQRFHFFRWMDFGRLWPLILVVLGLYLLFTRRR